MLVECKLFGMINDIIIKRYATLGFNSNEIASIFCVKITAGFI
jgi:hypothetical protein